MTYIEAIILGLVQGLTEFLPISSSAHLRIIGDLFGWQDPGAAFTAIIQLGTEAAVLTFFWRDIVRIISKWFRAIPVGKWKHVPQSDPDVRMGWIVIVGTIPIGVLGLVFSHTIETAARNLYLVATVLIVFGLILGLADRIAKERTDLKSMSIGQGFLMGLGQALALIPGVSRSGGTITTGLLLGLTREAAARASFLLAIPAVVLSGFYELFKSIGTSAIVPGPTILATVISFVVGYLIIGWFLKMISTRSFSPFVWYRVALGALVLLLLQVGALTA